MKYILPLLLSATTAVADDAFVEANVIGIFYHELGHAVIDIEAVPIFGQEEDAADVFSIYLIDALFEEEAAVSLAYDAAIGFWFEAEDRGDHDLAWWDVHGPDEQRFYNTICLFYGAHPDAREDFAEDLELPQDRAEYCPEEYDQANAAWGPILDDMVARGPGQTLRFAPKEDSFAAQILATEIDALNNEMSLAQPLDITVAPCGEANAYYDPETVSITFCSEFEDHLRRLAESL